MASFYVAQQLVFPVISILAKPRALAREWLFFEMPPLVVILVSGSGIDSVTESTLVIVLPSVCFHMYSKTLFVLVYFVAQYITLSNLVMPQYELATDFLRNNYFLDLENWLPSFLLFQNGPVLRNFHLIASKFRGLICVLGRVGNILELVREWVFHQFVLKMI